jgi:hypothetical protein
MSILGVITHFNQHGTRQTPKALWYRDASRQGQRLGAAWDLLTVDVGVALLIVSRLDDEHRLARILRQPLRQYHPGQASTSDDEIVAFATDARSVRDRGDCPLVRRSRSGWCRQGGGRKGEEDENREHDGRHD